MQPRSTDRAWVGLVAPREPIAGLKIPHRKGHAGCRRASLTADLSLTSGHRGKRRQRAAAVQALAESERSQCSRQTTRDTRTP